VYDVTFIDFNGTNAHGSFDIEITPQARNWYINLWSPGKSLCAELGLAHPEGTFASLVRSNVIQTPPAWASPNTEERWVRPEREQAGHFLLQAPTPADVAASVHQAGLQEPSRSPGSQEGEVPQRPQECLHAEEHRRFLEEARRMEILGRDHSPPPALTASAMEEPARDLDTGLSSVQLVKKR
jgi:hypothetical protein